MVWELVYFLTDEEWQVQKKKVQIRWVLHIEYQPKLRGKWLF